MLLYFVCDTCGCEYQTFSKAAECPVCEYSARTLVNVDGTPTWLSREEVIEAQIEVHQRTIIQFQEETKEIDSV